jgi:hypothetical protein
MSIEPIRASPVQILVAGWDIKSGHDLAEDIVALVKTLGGDYVYSDETYNIKDVSVRNFPVLIQYDNKKVFSINVVITYQLTQS